MDDSENPKPEQVITPEKLPKKKKSKKGRILYILLVVILIGLLAGGGWFYYDATQTIQDQKDKISDLEGRLRDLGVEAVDGDDETADAASCAGGSSYSADIGKFELTLSDPNVIIRQLDGDFEGGPITQLSIGRCIEGETNVVDEYPTYEVKITGHPSSDSATLRSNFEASFGSPLTAGPSVTIDGVTAQTYTGSGLFATKLVYFDHNGIGYQIELTDTNTTSEAILTDVISDWNFTP